MHNTFQSQKNQTKQNKNKKLFVFKRVKRKEAFTKSVSKGINGYCISWIFISKISIIYMTEILQKDEKEKTHTRTNV